MRGTYGGLTQIATCLGIMGSLFIGIPAKEIVGWYGMSNWLDEIHDHIFIAALSINSILLR